MIYRLGSIELDVSAFELRSEGRSVAVEPQVLTMLLHFFSNPGRLITKDELIETIWEGRIVSDTAIASRVKSARQAIGDSGAQQKWIRTVHGKGYRFIEVPQTVSVARESEKPKPWSENDERSKGGRPSIAVLPFRILGASDTTPLMGEAIAQDIITELCRLRWLFVTARGSAFRVCNLSREIGEVGQILGVNYCLTGSIDMSVAQSVVSVELTDTRDESVIWAERYQMQAGEVHEVRSRITARIISSLELHISNHEAQLARANVSEHLDAWSMYHLGLQHMYRFNRTDNAKSSACFELAIRKDPNFARAHAGLSFCHFQTAFMGYVAEIEPSVTAARRHAERAVEIDMLDPFANFAAGRAFWLQNDIESSLGWLERSIALSPNFAQAIYAHGWAQSVMGDGVAAQRDVDLAISLSPLDPLHFAMLATRALAHLDLGEESIAAEWADKAALSPGAHIFIGVIAAACHALNGNRVRAAFWRDAIRKQDQDVNQEAFFRSFPFRNPDTLGRMSSALSGLGI